MWPYQADFCIQLKVLAHGVLEEICSPLEPTVWLVGVNSQGRDDYPVRIEPENDARKHDWFDGIHQDIQKLNGWSDAFVVRYAITDRLDKHIKYPFFVGKPVRIEDCWVSPVLEFESSSRDSMGAPYSLVEAVVGQILIVAYELLSQSQPGEDLLTRRFPLRQIAARAGHELMRHAQFEAGSQTYEELFQYCINIADARNENRESFGTICFTQPKSKPVLEFQKNVPFKEARWARKLLDLSTKEIALWASCQADLSLCLKGLVAKPPSSKDSDGLVVNFLGKSHWEFKSGSQVLMEVINGQPKLKKQRFDSSKFKDIFTHLFPKGACERLQKLLEKATEQSHGTTVVISNQARKEAERLARQSTLVKKCRISVKNLLGVTSIDGALLLDTQGYCHAVGVILDGKPNSGDPSRGARYNSALKYIDSNEGQCMVIVVSEDGPVTILPNLKPTLENG